MEIAALHQNLCSNVRYLRAKNHLSQQTLAKLLGISVKSLRSMEAGVLPSRIRCHTLCRIADVFDVSADALLYEDLSQAELT